MALWLILSGYYYFVFLKIFPGWVGYDDCHSAIEIMKGKAWGWQSVSYSFVLSVGYIILGKMGLVAFISITYFNYLALKVFQIIDQQLYGKFKHLVALIFLILCLHPTNQSQLLSHFRDILFSLILIHVGLIVFYLKTWNSKNVIFFSMLVIVLGDFRQDAKIYLLIIPIILYFTKIWNFQNLKVYLTTVIIAGFSYYIGSSYVLSINPYSNDYKVTAYVHPLSVVFKFKSKENFSPEEISAIDKVLSVDKLIQFYSPLDIVPFHNGAYNYKHSPEEWINFQQVANSLIYKNLNLIIKSRNDMFLSTINFGEPGLIFYDHLRSEIGTLKILSEKFKLTEENLKLSDTGNAYYKLLQYFNSQRSFLWSLVNSLILPLIFLLLCTLFFMKEAKIIFITLLVLARLPVIYFLAPASYYKYLYPILLFFIFVTPIAIIYFRNRFKSKKNSQSLV